MSFVLFPAIDLKGGACVRLRQGDMEQATVFAEDPGAQARTWIDAGFDWLHVVDLDGAFAGRSVNREAVRLVLGAAGDVPVQLGGGIRSMAAIEEWLAAGVRRVILGSAAARDPALVRDACRNHPGRVAVGIDVREGRVAVSGWAEASDVSPLELAHRFEDAGVAAVIYTDVLRDGMLGGVDVAGTMRLAEAVNIPVIASGGIGSLDDVSVLLRAARTGTGHIAGAIIGRALYDGRIDPEEVLRLVASPRVPESGKPVQIQVH